MRVLLIGGTSFIGPAVARELLADGNAVAVYHRGQTEDGAPEGVTHLHGDRDALAEARPALVAFAPDVVVHMILMMEEQARSFVRALTGVAPRAVVISSQDVYRAFGRVLGIEAGPPEPTPITESAPLRERPYPHRGAEPRADDDPMRWADDYDKIPVERVVMSAPDLPCAALRLPAVYGPGDRQHRLYRFARRFADGRLVIPLDSAEAGWRWTHAYVDDVAHAIALAATNPRANGRIYNVGETYTPTVAERARAAAEAYGWQGRIIALPTERMPQPLRADANTAQDLVADTARIRTELGYVERVPPGEAYARTLAWELAHPPQPVAPAEFDYAAEDAALAGE